MMLIILMYLIVVTSNYLCCSICQSAETLDCDGAAYPDLVEITTKGHALEAIEVGVLLN